VKIAPEEVGSGFRRHLQQSGSVVGDPAYRRIQDRVERGDFWKLGVEMAGLGGGDGGRNFGGQLS